MLFISYRKEEAGDLAWSLADRLKQQFGSDSVFLDRNQIAPGDRWREEIDRALSRAAVVLALIGPRWLTSYDEFGKRRIDRDDDVLAYELSVALSKPIPVIPLYFGGVKPLPDAAFPQRLVGLASKQGLEFDLARDFDRLCDGLAALPGLQRVAAMQAPAEGSTSAASANKPWCIPDSIGLMFKGRQEVIQSLRDTLIRGEGEQGDRAACRQVLSGLGGIGKTRLAIEYAWAFHDQYRASLFVAADNPDQMRRGMSELASPAILNLREWKDPDEQIRTAAVIRWLRANPGWLLIIDNADEKDSRDAVAELLPKLSGGHVLITSRYHRWSTAFVKRTEIEVLSEESAKAFLLERTKDERRKMPNDEAVAGELARELGCLALALEQAGAYIQHREGGLSLADYLERWRRGRSHVRDWYDSALMHYEKSVAVTWETTMRALDAASLTLFRILAWFAPDPVPRSMIATPGALDTIQKSVEVSGTAVEEIDPEQALSELIAYSLTKKIDEEGIACVALHRVVLEITRDRMPKEVQSCTLAAAAEILVLFAPKESYRPESWMDWRLLISHAEEIWMRLSKLDEHYWNIELLKLLALYYMGQGRMDASIPLQRTLLRLIEQRLSPDDPELFTAKNDLALMLEDDNEKEPLFREALAGQIRVRGVESIEAAETQHNLADFLRHGKPDEAEPLLRQALATFEKLLGPFHWRDLMTQKTLSRLLLANNKTEEGRAVLMDCVAKSEQHFPNSPDTAQIYDDLIDVLLKEGSLDEVAKYTRLAMGIYQQLGMEHPNTLRALNNYGYSLRKAGRIADAEQFDRHSSEASFRVLGENHPLTLHRRNNLVLTLSLLGRLGEAREILNQNIAAKPEPYENLTPRIFLLQSVVETLACPDGSPADHRSVTQPLGRLKTHLSRKPLPVCSGIAVPWDVRYFWENLRGKVAGDMVGLFESLVTVLNQRCASDPSAARADVSTLDQFAIWRDTPAEPLDVNAPGRAATHTAD